MRCRKLLLSLDLAAVFQDSRDHGLEPVESQRHRSVNGHRSWIWVKRTCGTYLTQNIHYRLDAGCLEGLQLFYRYAAEVGALPPAPELHFLDSTKGSHFRPLVHIF